jgi:hypothetical protein
MRAGGRGERGERKGAFAFERGAFGLGVHGLGPQCARGLETTQVGRWQRCGCGCECRGRGGTDGGESAARSVVATRMETRTWAVVIAFVRFILVIGLFTALVTVLVAASIALLALAGKVALPRPGVTSQVQAAGCDRTAAAAAAAPPGIALEMHAAQRAGLRDPPRRLRGLGAHAQLVRARRHRRLSVCDLRADRGRVLRVPSLVRLELGGHASVLLRVVARARRLAQCAQLFVAMCFGGAFGRVLKTEGVGG